MLTTPLVQSIIAYIIVLIVTYVTIYKFSNKKVARIITSILLGFITVYVMIMTIILL